MNIFKAAYYLEQLIQAFDLRNFYRNLEENAPKFFDFIKEIGDEKVEEIDIKFRQEKWSIRDMLNMGNEFYYNINPVYSSRINKFISQDNVIFHANYDNINNGTIRPVGGTILIKLGLPTDLRGPWTVVHEFGHILNQKFQIGKPYKTSCLEEIASIFFEKLFLYDQVQKGYITHDEMEQMLIDRQNDAKFSIQQLLYERDIVKCLGEPVKPSSILKAKLMLKDRDCKIKFKTMQTKEYVLGIKSYQYVLGELVAAALVEDYFKKPDDVMKRMDFFLDNSAVLNENQAFTLLLGKDYEQKIGFSFKETPESCKEPTK